MDWRVLGPLEVVADGSLINLGGRQRRLVLAILLANADQTVSTDRVVEEVWGGAPPSSARKTVQAHVAHLRGAVNGDAEFLSSSGDGYVLRPGSMTVDADRFEAAVAEARELRSGEPAHVASLLETTLAMFRGEPYTGLADDALTVKIEAARLDELRLSCREDRLDALLAAGDSARVIADVERLLAEHPMRERLWAIQMLALYRSGRQSEALNSFSRARRVLAEELGIEPSAELQALEQQILVQDSALLDSSRSTTGQSRAVEVRRNPYKGLRAFDEADAGDFFGRAELVRLLADRLTSRPPAALTLVAGPSGAGKSSVVRAGLVPALRDRGLVVAVMFPGDDPDAALDTARADALAESGDGDGDGDGGAVDVVIVDQFEEVFTATTGDAGERFIARMTDDTDPTLWVATVRADFLDDVLAHPRLGRLLQESLVLVPPLEDHEIEAAIVEPARHVGVDVDPSLMATVVRDVGARASSLPLMQYALTDLFERRRGDALTLDAYEREGGLSGALVRRADQVAQRLTPEGREAARQIFLQLVTIADNGEFARRRVERSSLHTGDPRLTDQILEQFGVQRLLTFDQDPGTGRATVELAHESLLAVWPLLARWIDEAREQLLMRSGLNTALAEWEANDRDPGFLLSGGRLAQHETWTTDTDLALTDRENEFLTASRRSEDVDRRRRRRRRNWITAAIATAAVVAIVLGVIAVQQANTANETQRVAKAEFLAAAANGQLDADPRLSMLLALESVELTRRVDGTTLPIAQEALHRAIASDRLIASLPHNNEGAAHFSPDGRSFVTSSEQSGVATVWSVDPLEPRFEVTGHEQELLDAVFDPTGNRIATTAFDRTARVYDASTGAFQLEIDPPGEGGPFIPVFSNDGSMLATSQQNGTAVIWDVETGDQISSSSLSPTASGAWNVAFSPDDELLLVAQLPGNGESVGPATLVEVTTGRVVDSVEGHAGGVIDVGFTPDGSRIVTSGVDGTVKIWETETGALVNTFRGHGFGRVTDLQISQDGTTVASSGEADVLVWDLATLQIRHEIYGHEGEVDGIDLSPDGTLLLTSSHSDLTTKLWDLRPWKHELTGFGVPKSDSVLEVPRGEPGGTAGGLAYHPDGTQIAASQESGRIIVRDPLDSTRQRSFEVPGRVFRLEFDEAGERLAVAGEGGVVLFDLDSGDEAVLDRGDSRDVAFGPDKMVAIAAESGTRVWESELDETGRRIASDQWAVDVHPNGESLATGGAGVYVFGTDGERLAALYPPFPAPEPPFINAVAYSPNGDWLASVGDDRKAVVWSTSTFEVVHDLEGHAAEVTDVDFHPTRPELATAGADATVRIWDVESGTPRLSIPAPGGISDLDHSPDGRYLAALSADGLVTVYMLDVDELVAEASTRLTRWWTESECRQYLDTDTCPEPPEHLVD